MPQVERDLIGNLPYFQPKHYRFSDLYYAALNLIPNWTGPDLIDTDLYVLKHLGCLSEEEIKTLQK